MSFYKRCSLKWPHAVKLSAMSLGVACAFFVNGCSVSEQSANLSAYVKPNVSIELPSLNTKPFTLEELLTAHYNKDTHPLLTVLSSNGHDLNLEVLTPTGIRLIGANFDGKTITTTKYMNIDKLPDANQVLFDILLCHAQKEDVQKVLPLNYKVDDTELSRVLSDDEGNPIYSITYVKYGDAQTAHNEDTAHDDDSNIATAQDVAVMNAPALTRVPTKIENLVLKYTIELQELN